jgi:hypothetical protein
MKHAIRAAAAALAAWSAALGAQGAGATPSTTSSPPVTQTTEEMTTLPGVLADPASDYVAVPAPYVETVPGPTGLRVGPLRILPSVSLGLAYDSNPTYASRDEKSETIFRVSPVLDLLLRGNGWSANGRGWMLYDTDLNRSGAYADIIQKAHYGESLGVHVESARGTRLTLTEMYEYQNRNDYVAISTGAGTYNASWQDRQSWILGGSIDQPLGEKTACSAGASYSLLTYDNAGLYDWSAYSGTLGFRRQLTSKTDLALDGSASLQTSEGNAADSTEYQALIGLASRATAKVNYKAQVGARFYDYGGGGGEQAASWTYNLSGAWRATSRLAFTLAGSADYQPSELDQNNYSSVETLMAGMTYQATRRLTASLSGIYRLEEWQRQFAGFDALGNPLIADRLDNQVSLYGRLNYQLEKHVGLFVGADVTQNESSFTGADYDRLFLEAGVNIRF